MIRLRRTGWVLGVVMMLLLSACGSDTADSERFCEIDTEFDELGDPFELPPDQARAMIDDGRALLAEMVKVAPEEIRPSAETYTDSILLVVDLFEAADYDFSQITEDEIEALFSGENEVAFEAIDDWIDANCSTAAPSTNTIPTTEGVLATPLPADVTETYTIPGFGYSIDYPADWFVTTDDSFTLIAQTEEEFAARPVDPTRRTTYSVSPPIPPAVTLRISLDHRTVLFLQRIGLTSDDPTAQDLLEFNIDNFDWTVLRDLGEVEIFGTTAAVVRVTDPDGSFSIQYQGVLQDSGEVFIFGFAGPTEESVDAFLPAWETIIESITATE